MSSLSPLGLGASDKEVLSTIKSLIPSSAINNPEIALARYRAIPNSTARKIAWVGDSLTENLFNMSVQGVNSVLSTNAVSTTNGYFNYAMSIAAQVVTTYLPHGLSVGDTFYAGSTGNGFVSGTKYMIATAPTASSYTCTLATGGAVTLTNGGPSLFLVMDYRSISNMTDNWVGGPFYNAVHGNFGLSGISLQAWLANGATGKNLADVVAFAPNLVVFMYGTNDVRLGTRTLAQLQADIITAVGNIKAAMPNTDIILSMPPTFCLDTTSGFIGDLNTTDPAVIQTRADILYTAYMSMIGQFSNVYVLNTREGQRGITPRKVIGNAGDNTGRGQYMNDAIHYSPEGVCARVRETARLLGNYGDAQSTLSTVIVPTLSAVSEIECKQAKIQTAVADYVAYPRILENPTYYNRLIKGDNNTSWTDTAQTFLDLECLVGSTAEKFLGIVTPATDILAQYNVLDTTKTYQEGVNPISLSGSTVATSAGVVLRFSTVPGVASQGVNAPLMLYRPRPATQKYNYDPDINIKIGSATLTGVTITNTVARAGAISVITGIAATAVTSGTIVVNVNGVALATLTFTASVNAVGSGVFFTAATAGKWLNEGDIITCVFTLTGGSLPVVTLSNS
jgi:lysophospholipase L1-like esterase